MGKQTLHIMSNFARLEEIQNERFAIEHRSISYEATWIGCLRLFIEAMNCDALIINMDSARLYRLCCLCWLWPLKRFKLISVDLILLPPMGWKQRIVARIKRLLLRKVDRFILYFTDVQGYERFYGISAARCSYVPFKVDSWEDLASPSSLSPDGEYIFSGGRTLRDLPTFIAAMRRIAYPGILLHQHISVMREHGTKLELQDLPPNLRAVEDGDDQAIWLEYIRKAKVVVVPTLPHSINAAGIGTYLMAMALKKCVIITEGVATRGVLRNEAIVVPPNNPVALAQAICLAWENDELRERTAAAGRRYAEQLGGENRLLTDIIEVCGMSVFDSKALSGNADKGWDDSPKQWSRRRVCNPEPGQK
jgi:glycosyltransferase involved in cell wall biosynthesis